ncbi:MAG: class F sortase [Candidatus Paceibacterota bacterium]
MKSEILLKWLLLLLFLTIPIIVFFLIISAYNPLISASSLIQDEVFEKKVELGYPVQIMIPKINVDAVVESVGFTSKGEMDAADGPLNAAWFNIGPIPGEIGNSVIDGHSGWKDGTPAVFDDLYKLAEGDKIYIKNQNGEIVTFVVRSLRIYGKNENTLSIFNSNDGLAHLNLITCAGKWNKNKKSSYDRLVVFSDKEI